MNAVQRRLLASCCVHAGMAGLARCCAYMRAGEIEAALNRALDRTEYELDKSKWFRLEAAKDAARRIRKPINELTDYRREVRHCLSL